MAAWLVLKLDKEKADTQKLAAGLVLKMTKAKAHKLWVEFINSKTVLRPLKFRRFFFPLDKGTRSILISTEEIVFTTYLDKQKADTR